MDTREMSESGKQAENPVMRAMAGGAQGVATRAYYYLKPFIPRNVSWALRRTLVPCRLKQSEGLWPIDESAARKPEGWRGWPGGREFALVFTHDVESKEGVRGVRRLAEMEMDRGFRSSFNFIPEGRYRTPAELRAWLLENGFEVGVHDLHHDGRLFDSREGFRRKARRINGYLKEWGAAGFRSGFMLRQLDWLHDLDIVYDASTFDTDPFEPQPEGSRTIFPFHVKAPAGVSGAGYVELSYTLAQDSTLYILMRERSADVWKRKLDWVAANGGLALVNIHPDYIDFSGGRGGAFRYPVGIVKDFLEYIGGEYEGRFWNPLARDLAVWFRDQSMNNENTSAAFAGGLSNTL